MTARRTASTGPQRQPPPRQGPRPLPLHLGSAALLWIASRSSWPLSRQGLLPWKPEIAAVARDLEAGLAAVDPDAFGAALDAEIARQAATFAVGINRYQHHPYRRNVPEPAVLWQEGTTRLLDYASATAAADGGVHGGRRQRPPPPAAVLVIPSLINRSYILDLSAENSLLRHLAGAGLRPLLVDWGRPDETERRFDLTAYVAGRLDAAFEAAAEHAGSPLAVVGYCMGGLLALALAERRRREVSALALLATPWDFHADAPGGAQARLLGGIAAPLAAGLAPLGEIPVDVLQALFAALDPLLALRKFSRFAGMPPDAPGATAFVALEDWLNDGIPLALPVAREVLGEWYGGNAPAQGAWRIAGTPVRPERFDRPSLVIVPERDRIVRPASAAALAERLPRATRLTPALGHIGMVVAGGARASVWRPLADWLTRHADAGGDGGTASARRRRRAARVAGGARRPRA
jgi:polyhydroxyalkanoate synthase